MKAASIALLILGLILPSYECCYSDTDAANLRAGLNYSTPLTDPGASNDKTETAKNDSIRWYHGKLGTELTGVALVIHGLNCRPDKMEAIISTLNAGGIDCLNVSLRGHGTNFSPIPDIDNDAARMAAFKTVSYPLWRTEAYAAYQLAKKKSDLNGKPLFLVGFSMGGLLGVDLMTSNSNVGFDKMVLFAPAITMLQRNYLLKVFSPFPGLVIPSAGEMAYLANDGTPMAAYNALFEMHAHFEKHLDAQTINIPAVVFIDEEDELISYSGLQEMVQSQHLDQWKIHMVRKDKDVTAIDMHHLVIDGASVGNHMWREIAETTLKHLMGRQFNGTGQ